MFCLAVILDTPDLRLMDQIPRRASGPFDGRTEGRAASTDLRWRETFIAAVPKIDGNEYLFAGGGCRIGPITICAGRAAN